MLRLRQWLGAACCLSVVACSGSTPFDAAGSEGESIVGGQLDTTDHAVFGILIKDQALCSGTLIAPNLVLTARHCVADVSTGENPIDCANSTFSAAFSASSFVLSSTADLTKTVPQDSVFHVSSVHTPDDAHFCGNDVALLTLSSNVTSGTAAPIAPRVAEEPQDEETYSAVGYGLTDPNDTQGTTAGVRHDISGLVVGCVGSTECQGSRVADDEWASNSAICSGDSGGPALDSNGLVIGVASRGDQTCAVGLYSSVASWKTLIVNTAVDAATSGGYTPPAWTNGAAGTTSGAGGTSAGGAANVGGVQGGGRSAVNGTGGGLVTPGPMLGEACTTGCFGDLLCYSATREPPGVCVPPCSATKTACPDTYGCNTTLGACVPLLPSGGASGNGGGGMSGSAGNHDEGDTSSGCGCRVGADRASASPWPAFAMLAFCGGMLRRVRRRATRA